MTSFDEEPEVVYREHDSLYKLHGVLVSGMFFEDKRGPKYERRLKRCRRMLNRHQMAEAEPGLAILQAHCEMLDHLGKKINRMMRKYGIES